MTSYQHHHSSAFEGALNTYHDPIACLAPSLQLLGLQSRMVFVWLPLPLNEDMATSN